MWEKPEELWRRLNLGREEFLQRLMTTLIVGGDPPRWNTPRPPSDQGQRFLRLLDDLAHGDEQDQPIGAEQGLFVDEYLLPKLEEAAANGWPDWAVLWSDRVWVIELKTEAASHREAQLPYYLLLAAAAHEESRVDLTYITGPLRKPAPSVGGGQRYSHLTWDQVLRLVEEVWGNDDRTEVSAYVGVVRTLVSNLSVMRPFEQRAQVLGLVPSATSPLTTQDAVSISEASPGGSRSEPPLVASGATVDLLGMARKTAADGRQRAIGTQTPSALETLRDRARAEINGLPAHDPTRFVLPWLWRAERTGGSALTPEGSEFGYELRFSRYQQMQVKP
jgi:hypothetical protein